MGALSSVVALHSRLNLISLFAYGKKQETAKERGEVKHPPPTCVFDVETSLCSFHEHSSVIVRSYICIKNQILHMNAGLELEIGKGFKLRYLLSKKC